MNDNRRNRDRLLHEFLYQAVLDPAVADPRVSLMRIHYHLPIGVPAGSVVEGVGACSAALERQSCANVAAVRVAAEFVAVTLVPLTIRALLLATMERVYLVLQQHDVDESLARAAGNQRQPPVGARSQL